MAGWNQPFRTGFLQLVPGFTLKCSLISMVDGASLGLVLFVLLVAGVVLAIRRDRQALNSWRGWAFVAGAVGCGLALSHFVPGAVGRILLCIPVFCRSAGHDGLEFDAPASSASQPVSLPGQQPVSHWCSIPNARFGRPAGFNRHWPSRRDSAGWPK